MGYSIGVGAAVVSALAAGGSAVDQHKAQGRAENRQEQAQQRAQSEAASAQREADMANADANARQPDVSAILESQQLSGPDALARTRLSGQQGVDPSALRLGAATLLGQ